MEFHTGAFYAEEEVQQPQATQQRRQATVPNNIEAVINNLAAQVRHLNSRLAAVESTIPTLAKNDKATADYVNRLGEMVSKVNTQTQAAVQALRAFARGGGVQPQQFVPRASDAVVAYDTPPRGQPGVEPVDPGGESADQTTEIDYNEAIFHGLIDGED